MIQRDQFPDKLFAPAKRETLLPDGANPVYDKEIRSEIFSQGTLMLRLVIQVSMLLAIPLMAFCLYIWPEFAAWYIAYVVVFNMLVGPVFSAGSVTSERERQTLDLLLTTTITPWQILWGKLLAGLRVSSVLTMFLVWPVAAGVRHGPFVLEQPVAASLAYVTIVLLTCVTTAVLALFCSVIFRKTSISLMTTYLLIILLFCVPLAVTNFAQSFLSGELLMRNVQVIGVTSPFSAAFQVPLKVDLPAGYVGEPRVGNWWVFGGYVAFSLAMAGVLLLTMVSMFNTRWRVAEA